MWPRSAAVQSLLVGRQAVVVTGTHGKTTTTSMLVTALLACGADPSYAVGSTLNTTGLNAADGRDAVFVVEGDESDAAILVYDPFGAVVTNVDVDHLDFFGTPEAYAAGLRRVRRPGRPRRVSSSAASTTRVAAGWPLAASELGLRTVTVGTHHSARLARRRHPSDRDRVDLRGRGRCGPAGHADAAGPRPGLRRRRPGRAGGRPRARPSVRRPGPRAGRLPGHRSPHGAEGLPGRRPGLRQLRPPSASRSSATWWPPESSPPVDECWCASSLICSAGRRPSPSRWGGRSAPPTACVVMDVYPAREAPVAGVTGALVARAVPLDPADVVYEPDPAAGRPSCWSRCRGRATWCSPWAPAT